MGSSRAPTVAGAVVTLALAASFLTLGIRNVGHPGGDLLIPVVAFLAVLSCIGSGTLIGLRRPGNRVGLLLVLAGLCVALMGLAEGWAIHALIAHPGSLPAGRLAAVVGSAMWPLLFVGVIAIAFVYPTGELPSPRWRAVAWSTLAAVVAVVVIGMFSHEPIEPPLDQVVNPLPEAPSWVEWMLVPLVLTLLVGFVASALAPWRRYRTSSADEQAQIRWFALAASLMPLALVACLADAVLPGESGRVTLGVLIAGILLVPVCICIAILKYRLYDIDRLMHRALVYALWMGCVVIAWATLVAALGALTGGRTPLVSAVSTVVVALVATAILGLLRRLVDRHVYGHRRDPAAGIRRMGAHLESSAADTSVIEALAASIADVARVPFVRIEITNRDDPARPLTHAYGDRRVGAPVALELVFRGEVMGVLTVHTRSLGEAFTRDDERLLADVAHQTAIVAHSVRLADELQRSREGIVVAREGERRRVRRNLHDGLGPSLAALVFQVDAARDAVTRDPDAAVSRLVEIRRALQQAVADVRTIVYDLRPPTLDELGLTAAIEEQAARLGAAPGAPTIAVEVPDVLPDLPAAVEVAAFRIAVEAISNVVRHASATSCLVRIDVDRGGALVVDVCDDGIGAAGAPRGVGMQSMQERAAELGARLDVARLDGGGTRIAVRLPIAVAPELVGTAR